ncbi:MAG: protease pro-enzyme activation domain-containing protein, partial [Terriglobia bacterium]
MSRQFKPLSAITSIAAFAAVGIIAFVSAAYASPAHSPNTGRSKPAGLTSWGIANAGQGDASSTLVRMAPQSNLALLSRAEKLGPHAQTATMKLTIGLKLRNVQKLKRFLAEVQNPGNPKYHSFLTPARFTELYGPTQAQVDAVKTFLQQNGIRVLDVSPNRTLIHTEASTAAFERAFAISINDYKLNGRSFLGTQDRPQIPRTLTGTVLSVLGLDNSQVMRPHSRFKTLAARSGATGPDVAPPPATSSSAYFNPSQISTAYDWPDITNSNNGAGVSVAIITADSSGFASDNSASTFWNAYGLPGHTINVIPVDGDEGLTNGMVETLLDVEWSGAMAPGITQNVYVAADPYLTTFTDAYNQFVNDGT